MELYVCKVGGEAEGLVVPVQMAHPAMERRVTGTNIAEVTLEVLHVDGLCWRNRG